MASFDIKRKDGSVYTVLVDDADYERVMAAGPWHVLALKGSKPLYVQRNVRGDGKKMHQTLHRFLLDAGDLDVDHINGDGLDNRRSNLRVATRSENLRNKGPQRSNTSGFKGVSWAKRARKWESQIRVDGKRRHLGYHPTPEAAHAAYCRAARELHGDFARTA